MCYSNPCANDGQCIRKEGGYTCICKTGYAGINCQLDLKKDACKGAHNAQICKSNGHCVSQTPAIGMHCANCTVSWNSNAYTPLCQLRSRSFYRGSFLTFPALKQRYRLHLKLRYIFSLAIYISAFEMGKYFLVYNQSITAPAARLGNNEKEW